MKRFLTFGAGANFIDATNRLVNQASKTNIFDESVSYNDTDLKQMPEFWSIHGQFIKNNPRLYGYAIWKPFLVMKELERLKDGDILFYADSGCEFDLDCENPKEEFEKIMAILKEYKFIATLCNSDRNMNKMDTVYALDMQDHPECLTEQIQSTTFVLEKCERTTEFVKEWYELCCNYFLINDDPSVRPNRDDFDEHRHEQSVMSLLLKKKGLYPIPKDITLESVLCLSRNRSGRNFPACRVTGSSFYSLHFGDEFIEGNQIIQMSRLVRKHNPQIIFETGFGSGRTVATMIQSCRTLPILKYVNCDKNYNVNQISYSYRKYCHEICPFFKSYEKESSKLLRSGVLKEEFSEGIDWFTVDGDPTYLGCLCELVSVLPHMKCGGIIYVVGDRARNVDIRDACDLFSELFESRLTKVLDNVAGKEICHFIVQ
jgi:hypothetical protein